MNTVEPLRDKRQIEAIRKILLVQNPRDAARFTVGINSGLRIGDLLQLRIGDVRVKPSQWRDRFVATEQKPGSGKIFRSAIDRKKP
jgi:integrase